MKKISFAISGICIFVAAFFGAFVPALSAAPADKGSPRENWRELFADGLFRADGTEVTLAEALKKKKYVGIYASASWCGPCRYFTPQLVEFYKEFGDQMEVVLVGCDDTQEEVFKYMRDHEMPWLTVNKASSAVGSYKARNGIRGIPNFRFYDAKTGKLLVANEINLRVIRRVITGEKDTVSVGTPENWKTFFAAGLLTSSGKKVPFDSLKKKKFIGVYCADERSPECAKFTAKLAPIYRKHKKQMEVIFFTYGKTQEEVLKYAKKTKMPWLVMVPNPNEAQRFLMKNRVKKLPDFRIFDENGKEVLVAGTKLDEVQKLLNGKR